jgi:hypothetical protein
MLVRALKVLGYFLMRQPARTSTRQPLISRAMKLALMTETGRIGNLNRETGSPDKWADAGKRRSQKGQEKCRFQPNR